MALPGNAPGAGAAVVRCAEIGWRIRVPLLPGGAMQPAMAQAAAPARAIRAAPVIRRGDPVEIRTARAGFSGPAMTIHDVIMKTTLNFGILFVVVTSFKTIRLRFADGTKLAIAGALLATLNTA